MSTKTLKQDDRKLAKSMMISQRCLGIVLKRVGRESGGGGSSLSDAECDTLKNGECGSDPAEDWMFESGYLIFQEFQEENRQCFWNQTLVDSVDNVEYMGYVAPGTLLTCGNEYYLETLRSAWARRVLKAPANFVIKRLGDVTGLEMQVIPQTQFTPLPEALCLVISELNRENETASLEIIFSHLQDRFSDMLVPNQEIVYQSLGKLIKDRKVYHTGDGYFIVTPVTYHMTTMSTLPERPLLMSNEEAIHKLHGELLSPSKTAHTRTRSIQTNIDEVMLCSAKSPSSEYSLAPTKLERSGSLRLSRKEKHRSQDDGSFVRSESMKLSPQKSKSLIKDINLKSSPVHQNVEKGEKVSVFSKLFRRSSSRRRKSSKSPAKYATFSAQFPPLEWSDPAIINYHSRSTQTLEGRSSSRDSRPVSASLAPVTIFTPASPPPITNTGSSQTSIKSKTDSLTRLRDHDKSNHRSRSSTLDSVLEPALERPTPRSSALPRKILSHSSVNGQEGPSPSPTKTSVSPKRVSSSSRASLLQSGSPSKGGKSHPRTGADGVPLRDPCKVSNTEQCNENLHASAAALNKMDAEAKVKNTELRNDEEYKLSEVYGTGSCFGSDLAKRKATNRHNRWSVHGSEGTMNNVVASPRKVVPGAVSPKHSGIKCINKLHSSSAGSSPVHRHPGNVTAAVRPTQAIRPMNQTTPEGEPNGGLPEKVSNTGPPDPSLTPSLSFSKSFDLESADFKSITAHKLLKGISINSIDTLVEVNLAAETGPPAANHYAKNLQAANGNRRPKAEGSPTKEEEVAPGKGALLNNAPMPKRYGDYLKNRHSVGKGEFAKSPVEKAERKKLLEANSPTEGTKVTALV